MNRETLVSGMTQYAGIALLLLAALFVGAFDLLLPRQAQARYRRCPRWLESHPPEAGDRATHC